VWTVKQRAVRDRLEAALARIADPDGEGARACLTVYAQSARIAADAADARAGAGLSLGPLDGAIVSIKDLFDVKGEPTRAGSTFLAHASPAMEDAPVIRRLRAAGAVIVAKTNMTEFAFSGIGLNPHYGTPGNPADRSRIPGGSSSGAAVAVANAMCEIAIGTDTGGSTRIPAGLCGIVGFKPSQWRVPTEGAFPLSFTFGFRRAVGAHGCRLRARRRCHGGGRAARARAGTTRGLAARRFAGPGAARSR
jgi:aspartyl-tRNA(Asn)/glutamyl-tRNA(Gln) amidotransferase subunit A